MTSQPLLRAGAVVAVGALVIAVLLVGSVPAAVPVPVPVTWAASAAEGGPTAALAGARLPERVDAPGTWSEAEHEGGPVAAVGIATRTRPVGLFDRAERLSAFAVSAVDGRSRWLRLPGFSLDAWDLVSGVALSPDGRWLGWVRPTRLRRAGVGAAPGGSLRGWSVMDTTTGDVRRLDHPRHDRLWATVSDLEFSGDSRWLLTSYEEPGAPQRRGHHFAAWDVRTGEQTVLEEPGAYWLPNLGSAASDVVWARGREVHRVDPVAPEERTTVRLPSDVVTASWGPDDAAFAWIGRTLSGRQDWRLHVGADVQQARTRVVRLPGGAQPSQLLGWVDDDHVVVGRHRDVVHVVDVVDGSVVPLDLGGRGDQLNAPSVAEGLWSRPFRTPAAPEGLTDPRRPWRWAAAAFGASFVVLLVVGRRRVRRSHGR